MYKERESLYILLAVLIFAALCVLFLVVFQNGSSAEQAPSTTLPPDVTSAPQIQAPTTQVPVQGTEPATEPPVTEPLATEPPATEPPVTEPPVTEPPVTEPPVTEPPITEPPVTEPPMTEPPMTEPPATEPTVESPQDELAQEIVQQIADEIMAMPDLSTDLERIAVAARMMNIWCRDCQLVDSGENWDTAYGFFVEKKWSQYSCIRAMGLVLDALGYEWYFMNEDNSQHKWLIVYDVDGQTGFADPNVVGLVGYGDRYDVDAYYYDWDEGLVLY